MIKINLNEQCKVKLTEHGRNIILTKYKEFLTHDQAVSHIARVTDGYGYSRFQLWELFEIFGSEIFLTMGNPPFVDNDICFN